jgi:Uma2 family endonuclease
LRIIVAMTALPKTRMTVDEYLAWSEQQPGRFELFDGTVIAMAPQGAGHAEKKAAVHAALLAGIRARGLTCHALPDGMTVRIDDLTAYEPDALVYCGTKLPSSALEVPNPIVVVEILSPSTRHIDLSAKLVDYFRLPSIAMRAPLATPSSRGSSARDASSSIHRASVSQWLTSTQSER